jgi:hypothetical protein
MREAKQKRKWQDGRPSLASHALSEEDVEAITAFYDQMIYSHGWSLDRRIEHIGDQAVAAYEKLPRCTDAHAKVDPWHADQAEGRGSGRRRRRRRNKGVTRYQEFRALGLCGHCGAEDLTGGTEAQCAACLEKDRVRHRRYYERKKAERELQRVRGRMAAALSSVARRLAHAVDVWNTAAWE